LTAVLSAVYRDWHSERKKIEQKKHLPASVDPEQHES